jgi:hypothetical protein
MTHRFRIAGALRLLLPLVLGYSYSSSLRTYPGPADTADSVDLPARFRVGRSSRREHRLCDDAHSVNCGLARGLARRLAHRGLSRGREEACVRDLRFGPLPGELRPSDARALSFDGGPRGRGRSARSSRGTSWRGRLDSATRSRVLLAGGAIALAGSIHAGAFVDVTVFCFVLALVSKSWRPLWLGAGPLGFSLLLSYRGYLALLPVVLRAPSEEPFSSYWLQLEPPQQFAFMGGYLWPLLGLAGLVLLVRRSKSSGFSRRLGTVVSSPAGPSGRTRPARCSLEGAPVRGPARGARHRRGPGPALGAKEVPRPERASASRDPGGAGGSSLTNGGSPPSFVTREKRERGMRRSPAHRANSKASGVELWTRSSRWTMHRPSSWR